MQQVSRANKIIDSQVKNPNEESLGNIKEWVMDPESDQVAYEVVSFDSCNGQRSRRAGVILDDQGMEIEGNILK